MQRTDGLISIVRAAAHHISVSFKDELLGQLRQALKDGNWLPLTVQILDCACVGSSSRASWCSKP